MKKILFISHTGSLAGAENVLIEVIKVVSLNSNNQIFVVCPSDNSTAFEEEIKKVKIQQFNRLPYRVLRNTFSLMFRNLLFSCLSFFPLIYLCKKNKIDIIYSNTSVNIIGVIVAFLLKKKHIWHIHEQSTSYHRWTPACLDIFYKKAFLRKDNFSLFVSYATKEAWEKQIKHPIDNCFVLYSKFNKLHPSPIKERKIFTFGFLGGLTNNKNVNMLIDSFSEIPNANLIIGGTGEKYVELQKYILQISQNNRIQFVGKVTDIIQFYASIDVLVQPSLNESWGLVALEAISAGKCVIMTNKTGLVEILSSKECIFFDPTSKEQLLAAMRLVISDPTYRQLLATNATNTLNKLNLNQHFDINILQILKNA